MSAQVERLEHNMVKVTIEIAAEEFGKAITRAYNKNKKNISIPGFRKGHVPQQLVEKMYGAGVFYEDAANDIINSTYGEEAKSTGLEFVSRPEFDVTQIEKGKDFIYTATVAVRPEVTLGEYKGLEVKKRVAEVTESEVDDEIRKEQEKNARMIDIDDRGVEKGDTVNLDYSGSVDGEKFDGGTASGQTLVIGSNAFIPGFEDQLIGVLTGEECKVYVKFPEEYHSTDLAGKDAVFECKVNKIQKKELPELNDDFAQDVSEFDTMEEYRNDVREKLLDRKSAQVKSEKENEAVDKLIEISEMDIPEAMINSQAAQMYQEFAQRLQSQGIPVDMYFQYQGSTPEKALEDMKPQAKKQIETRLVLEEVAKAAGIEITDEKVDQEIERIATAYQMEKEKLAEVMSDFEKEQIKKDLAVQEAITLIADNAKEV